MVFDREYGKIYRGPGFLAVVLLFSSLSPPPDTRRIMRPQDSMDLYKSYNTLHEPLQVHLQWPRASAAAVLINFCRRRIAGTDAALSWKKESKKTLLTGAASVTPPPKHNFKKWADKSGYQMEIQVRGNSGGIIT